MNRAIDYNRLFKEGWCEGAPWGPTKRHQRRLVKKLLSPLYPSSILEVGCGDGINLEYVSGLFPGAPVVGIDVSETAVESARKRLPLGRFFVLDAAREKLPEEFDLVYSLDVLEHIEDDLAVLKNAFAMTRPGGRFLVMTLQGRMRDFEAGIGHVRNYKPGELENKCRLAGFHIEKKLEWGFPFFSPLYRNFLDIGEMNRKTYGRPGRLKSLLSRLLYLGFFLNRSHRGDVIFILGTKIVKGEHEKSFAAKTLPW